MWHCKITWLQIRRPGYSNLKLCVCWRKGERGPVLLTAEITSPAALRTVLHHGGSWNNDVTFEPQPGPDQMVDFLIKYLSAPGNYPTSVWLFDGHCKTVDHQLPCSYWCINKSQPRLSSEINLFYFTYAIGSLNSLQIISLQIVFMFSP